MNGVYSVQVHRLVLGKVMHHTLSKPTQLATAHFPILLADENPKNLSAIYDRDFK